VATFGELLLRLSPPGHLRIGQGDLLEMWFGGAEANVAVALARLGDDVQYITRVPDNLVGAVARQRLNELGVGTDQVLSGGSRMPICFVEVGAAQRPSVVVYDRSASPVAQLEPGMVPWPAILSKCSWLHTSGITPALSQSAAAATIEAVTCARDMGVRVSIDLNYRASLWDSVAECRRAMAALVEKADVVFCNEDDLEKVFGIDVPPSDHENAQTDPERYMDPSSELLRLFPSLDKVVMTLRGSVSASDNYWTGVLATRVRFCTTHQYHITPIVDRVGAGDAFAGAAIHGFLEGWDDSEVLSFAVAASCLKHSIHGDFNLVDASTITALASGGEGARIVR
jgi:2-dehydro-3-deoxygluconokinase